MSVCTDVKECVHEERRCVPCSRRRFLVVQTTVMCTNRVAEALTTQSAVQRPQARFCLQEKLLIAKRSRTPGRHSRWASTSTRPTLLLSAHAPANDMVIVHRSTLAACSSLSRLRIVKAGTWKNVSSCCESCQLPRFVSSSSRSYSELHRPSASTLTLCPLGMVVGNATAVAVGIVPLPFHIGHVCFAFQQYFMHFIGDNCESQP